MNSFCIYIYFPLGLDSIITSKDEGRNFIEHIRILLDLSDCEKNSILYFDGLNKEAFFQEIDLLQEDDMIGFFGTFDVADIFNYILLDAKAKEFRETSLRNNQQIYYNQWITDGRHQMDDFPEILKEITEKTYLLQQATEKILFLNICNAYSAISPINIIRGDRVICSLINIEYVSSFTQLDEWLQKNRSKRTYNFEDHRHIENDPHYLPRKSPLLGGHGGKKKAEVLLNSALCDKQAMKDLVNFDATNNCYIWYEYEGETVQNQFHGYHLVIPFSHEIDKTAEAKIPQRLKDILKYRVQQQ